MMLLTVRLAGVMLFEVFQRRPGAVAESTLSGVPLGFTAVGEALASGRDLEGPCLVAGQRLAESGAGIDEVLDGLLRTHEIAGAGQPAFAAVRALTTGWAESSLQYLHALSCEDPLTGLATTAHARTRLDEIYREADCSGQCVPDSHGLVVVELVDGAPADSRLESLDRALRFVDVVDAVRSVYPAGETVARVGARRAVTLVRRTAGLGEQVRLLRQLLVDWRRQAGRGHRHRVWVEGLPPTNEAAGRLLDELAR
ncbi:MAG: hypothetical protein ACRDO1_02935 [Nocardioidaceae bacterium]